MAAICTPTTGVQGHGTIAVEYLRQESAQVHTQYGDRINLVDIYKVTATPAAGWTFGHFEIETTRDNGYYVETPNEYHETVASTSNVYANPFTTPDITLITSYITVIGEYYGSSRYRNTWKTLTYKITAVFTRPVTDLLVNSSTVESPGKLVYDPATNKLVADY